MALSPKILRRQADVLVQTVQSTVAAVDSGSPADATLASFYRQHPEYGSRDRRLFSETVFSFFRWRGWLVPPTAPDLATACVLAHALDASTIAPAVAVLAENTALQGAALLPLGSLDLQAKAKAVARLTGTPAPSLLRLVPPWLPDVLRVPEGRTAEDHLLRAVTAFQMPPPTWLRIRPGHGDRVIGILRSAGIEPAVLGPIPDALAVPRGRNLRELSPQLRGLMEIQDLASQVTGLICAPRSGQRWWDACCGSGGKALHMADLMAGSGRLLATDVRPGILESLDRRLREARVTTVTARLWDGLKQPAPAETFDGVLVDAPCSGIGTWHRNPDARWRTNADEIRKLVAVQSALLVRCGTCVRPGGVLVYATCTLTRPENDDVVRGFLEAAREFQPDTFPNPLDGSSCHGQMWIYPWPHSCNGMYIARLRRFS